MNRLVASLVGSIILAAVVAAPMPASAAVAESDSIAIVTNPPAVEIGETYSHQLVTASSLISSAKTMPISPADVTGDVLGRGYEQRLIHHGDRVEILEPISAGGARIKEFAIPKTDGRIFDDSFGNPGAYGGIDSSVDTKPMERRIIVFEDTIVVTQIRTELQCSASACIHIAKGSSVLVYSANGTLLNRRDFSTDIAVTALDAVRFEGGAYLAIGLNRGGVHVTDMGRGGLPDRFVVHPDWDRRAGFWDRDAVTSVKFFETDGNLRLASGKVTYEHPAVVVTDVLTSGTYLYSLNPRGTWDPWEWPYAITANKAGGSDVLVVAYEGDQGDHVRMYNASSGSTIGSAFALSDPRAIRIYENAMGKDRVGVTTAGGGFVLEPAPDQLKQLGGTNSIDTFVSDYVPGYKPLRVSVENASTEKIKVSMASSPAPDYGCWLNSELVGAQPFPMSPLGVDAGKSTARFDVAAHTDPIAGGRAGFCDSSIMNTNAFVTVASDKGSGHQVARLAVKNGVVQITEQVGNGQYHVEVRKVAGDTILGSWAIVVSDQATKPFVEQAAGLSAAQLTSKMAPDHTVRDSDGKVVTDPAKWPITDPRFPVFRFTVTGPVVNLGSNPAETVTVPEIVAQGSQDGISWENLGNVVPQTAPTREGQTLRVGDATFDWQHHQKEHTFAHYRVITGGVPSEVVNIADVPAPDVIPFEEIGSITATHLSGPHTGIVRANGIDQAPISVAVKNENNIPFTTDGEHGSLYDRVYFRTLDANHVPGEVLTGLVDPEQKTPTTAVSPIKGQYPNDGTVINMMGTTASSKLMYASTTGVAKVSLRAQLHTGGTESVDEAGQGEDLYILGKNDSWAVAGSGAGGFFASDGASKIKLSDPAAQPVEGGPTNPAIYRASAGRLGIQLSTTALTGSLGLPLDDATQLAKTSLTFQQGEAKLASTAYLTGLTFMTRVVARGELLTVQNLNTN